MPKAARPVTPVTVGPQPLTDFQELVCNLAADLILRGGAEEDVANLLRAMIGHSLHLRFPGRDGWHEKRIERDLVDWLTRLSRCWPTKSEPEHAPPTTVTEMLRANLRGNLDQKFKEFVSRARMHELYLMRDVLDNFESNCGGPDSRQAESVLAEAFAYELDSDHTYVKVPRDEVEKVEAYLKAAATEVPSDAPEPVGRPKLLVFPARESMQEAPHAS